MVSRKLSSFLTFIKENNSPLPSLGAFLGHCGSCIQHFGEKVYKPILRWELAWKNAYFKTSSTTKINATVLGNSFLQIHSKVTPAVFHEIVNDSFFRGQSGLN